MAKEKTIIEKLKKGAEEFVEKIEDATEDIGEKIIEGAKKVVEEVEETVGISEEKPYKKPVRKRRKEEKEDKNELIRAEEKEDNEDVNKNVFGLYDISVITISDPGLKNVINLDYKLLIKSHGRIRERYGKANVNVIERLINTLCVPGHRGKKHKIVTSWATGKYQKNAKVVLEAFKIIEEKINKNPIQVLVNAIENGAPRDEVTMIQYGGARYPQAVDCAPLRRVSIALRNIVHGAYDKSFRSKKTIAQTLADELIVTAENGSSIAVNKKTELEKQADAAR